MIRRPFRLLSFAILTLALAPFSTAQEDEAAPKPKPKASHAPRSRKPKKPKYTGPVLDLLTASAEDLAKLPSLNEAIAKQIVAGRPFHTKADLVTKGIISIGQYQVIKDRVSVGKQPPKK